MKKYLRSVLGIILIFAMMCPYLAVSASGPSVDDENLTISSTDINYIINEDKFNELFNSKLGLTAQSEKENIGGEVEYSYSMVPVDSNRNKFNTILEFTLKIDGEQYPIHVSGVSSETVINPTLSVFLGNLVGNTAINEHPCSVTVGFLKAIDNNTINAGVTIIPAEANDLSEVVRFNFGGIVIPAEAVESKPTEMFDKSSDVSKRAGSDQYLLRASRNAGFSSYEGYAPSGYAQTVKLAYNEYKARAVVGLTTYTDSITKSFNGHLPSGSYASTTVGSATIGLVRNKDEAGSISSIDQWSDGGVKTGKTKGFANYLASLAMDVFGISSTLTAPFVDAIMDAASGFSGTATHTGAHSYISFENNPFNRVEFDDVPLSVRFNLMSNNSGTTKFYAYSDVSYITTVSDSVSYQVYSYDASRAQTVLVSLQINGGG